jgi:UDP-glucose:O-linked fucose beta-1,3-glucosyltransferase
LGERYGYHLLSNNGYNYITGGGGMVINLKVLQTLVKSCQCPSATSPDDMIIATCLHLENIEPIHSPLFKQARTVDYPAQILTDSTISFHKHWQIDPYRVYEKWFYQNDKEFYEQHRKKMRKNKFHKNGDENLMEFETKNENNQYLQQNVDDVFKHSDL